MVSKMAIFFLVISIMTSLMILCTASSPNISAILSFGDSTLDPGNNDHIGTLFRGDHMPYGRDLPGHPATGRFTNGRLITDILADYLGIKNLVPAYLDPTITDRDLATGVSFASAGSGLDTLTASTSNVVSMPRQVDYFQEYLGKLRRGAGQEEVDRIIGGAVFAISAGTNDIMWNYYVLPTRKRQHSLPQYHDLLLSNLQSIVQRLYSLGGRKFSIAGLPPIGCVPFQITAGSFVPSTHMLQRVCVDQQNQQAMLYNSKLQALINRIQPSLSGSKIAYVDIYNPLMDMIKSPQKYGFEDTTLGCCGTGLMEMGSLCNNIDLTCRDASKYVFWDAVHPTQTAYQVLANFYINTVLPQLS